MANVNYANLVLGADTRGLLKGKDALEATTRAGAKTEKAVGATEKGFVRAGRGAGSASRQIDGFNKSADRTSGVALAATRALGGMAAAFFSANALGRASQAYAEIGNSLRAMGVEADSVAGQIEAIGDIAKRTRAPLEGTAQLYQRISIAGKDLGASQQQVMRFTENVGLALAQQGGSAAAASGALLQLSQAMSGGTVRAEEFNSILEGAYPIAQAAANAIDGAAGSVGRLRTMVIDGEISSREFFDAILSSTEALEAAFGNTVPTVSQAMSVLSTSFTLFIGEMDSALGVSAALAEGIIFLGENIERIAIYAGTAAAVFGGAYVAGAALAAAKTLTFAGALKVLRGALIRTGIGALIVGAGELIYQFVNLVKTTGGVGEAFVLLGDVASGVWEGIVGAAAAIPPGLSAVWENVKSGFFLMVGDMLDVWSTFLQKMATSIEGIEAFSGVYDQLQGSITGVIAASSDFYASSNDAAAAAGNLKEEAASLASQGFDKARTALAKLTGSVENTETEASVLESTTSDLNETLEDTGGAGAKAAKGAGAAADELERAKTEAEAFNDALKEAAYTAEDMGTEKANILTSGIDGVSKAFGDFVADGFSSFKDFASNILDTFKGMLSQMIAMAAKNRIMIGMGISAGGVGGTAAQAAAPGGGLGSLLGLGGGGGGGILSGILGTAASGTGLIGGFSSVVSSLGMGGIGGAASSIGAAIGSGSLATAAGALAVPILGVAALFSFLGSKTKLLDSGLRITADATSTLVEEFEKIEKSRFWGLSKSKRTNFSPMENDGPIKDAVDAIKNSALELGGVLGLSADNFSSFASQITVSLKDLSDEEAQAAIQEAFSTLSSDFAYAALGHFQETMGGVIRDGETADQTLSALANSLHTANIAFKDLGFTLYEASVAGGVAAREFADLFGGVEGMAQATSAYYQRFYSDQEKVTNATRNMREAMAELGLIMPATIAGFRALVEQAERMGDMERVASLIGMSGAFAAVIDGQAALQDAAQQERDAALATATQDLQAAFAREMEATRATFQAAIASLQNELTGARERLAASRAIANALESALRSRVFPSVEAQRQSQDRAAQYLRSLVGLSEINDLDALQAALQDVANPSADTYETLEDYRRDFNLTSGVIRALEKTAGFALNADEQSVLLLEQQIAAMEAQGDREVAMLQQQLDALLGIQEGMQTLAQAISAFKAAGGGTSSGGSVSSSYSTTDYGSVAGTAASLADASNSRAIEQLYQEVLGRAADAAGLQFYVEAARKDTSISQIRKYLEQSQEAQTGVVPGFANGGNHAGGWRIVGERGPELEYTGPSRIMTNSQSRDMLDNSALLAEVRQLRGEMKAILTSVARNTGKSAALAQKRDDIGTLDTNEGDALLVKVVS